MLSRGVDRAPHGAAPAGQRARAPDRRVVGSREGGVAMRKFAARGRGSTRESATPRPLGSSSPPRGAGQPRGSGSLHPGMPVALRAARWPLKGGGDFPLAPGRKKKHDVKTRYPGFLTRKRSRRRRAVETHEPRGVFFEVGPLAGRILTKPGTNMRRGGALHHAERSSRAHP